MIPERIRSLVLTSTTAGNTSEVAPMSALKMFAKLFFIRDPQEMVKLVIANLYPEPYLEAPDEKEGKPTNRDRIVDVGYPHHGTNQIVDATYSISIF